MRNTINKGEHISPETEFQKGHKPTMGMSGKKHSAETRIKMSLNRLGNKNPRWIEDKNNLVKNEKKHLDSQYKDWMLKVKHRDNWKCKIINQDCKGNLEAHHILNWKDYPELRYDVNNGITLCHAHHPRGRENEAKLSPYFQKLVAEMQIL